MPHPDKRDKNTIANFMAVGPLFGYFIRVFKKDPNVRGNFNLRAMHTINKISILMFFIMVIVTLVRFAVR